MNDAGNMTVDKDGYKYDYDYENRIVKIEKPDGSGGFDEVAEIDYDALGRRIRVIDKSADPDVTTLYYHNPNWQVSAEYNGSNELQRYYVYGNYIDEALVMNDATDDFYYVQDHLYSTVALIGYVDPAWVVVERCEYDAYGKMMRYDPDCSGWGGGPGAGNPYYFTGRRLDVLDNGNLWTMHYRHRTYDTYTARFLQHDPLGIVPNSQEPKEFQVKEQYADGLNAYVYANNDPMSHLDPRGMRSFIVKCCEFTLANASGILLHEIALAHELGRATLKRMTELGLGDAFAHCTWSCRMARYIGPIDAGKIGVIHEICEFNSVADTLRDTHNNTIGIALGMKPSNLGESCEDLCQTANDNGDLVDLPAEKQSIQNAEEML